MECKKCGNTFVLEATSSCPGCDAAMNPTAIVCVNCGWNRNTDVSLGTVIVEADRKPGLVMPDFSIGRIPITVWIPAIVVLIHLGKHVGMFFPALVGLTRNLATARIEILLGACIWIFVRPPVLLFILVGLARGARLAWQWAVIGSGLGAVVLTGLIVSNQYLSAQEKMDYEGLLWGALECWLMIILLWTRSARHHFNLVCPECGSRFVKAVDFMFQSAKCRRCRQVF
ncbi:MAG: hypothetical protein IH987_09485 [Planctomycetes bacterium]|nr:hypothetical protein [Planctomycetota bacterium]